VQRKRRIARARKNICAFGWRKFEAGSFSLMEEGGTMIREIELIAISLVFVFLGAIVVGVIH
jgi:hypothetical protein